jgi:cell division protein FtsZ
MKSLVEEALARESAVAAPFGPSVAPARPIGQQSSSADAELLEMLKSLKTNIKIIGCGGGGSNTIDRISKEGIAGAEIYAAIPTPSTF